MLEMSFQVTFVVITVPFCLMQGGEGKSHIEASSSNSFTSSRSCSIESSASSSCNSANFIEKVKCCFKDQIISTCPNGCTENTCANVRNPPKYCTRDCQSKWCRCRKGLYQNENNECVTIDKCRTIREPKEALRCGDENEEVVGCFDEAKARVCPKTGYTKMDIFLNESSCGPSQCILNVCDCINGFLRNKYGKCVAATDCNKICPVKPSGRCPGLNEIRVSQFQQCKARTCRNLLSPPKCQGDLAEIQYNVCDCMEGYARDRWDRCISKVQCSSNVPSKCLNPCIDPNEEWQFGNDCTIRTCQNLYELPLKLCINTGYYRCDCSSSDDLWRNEKNECVRRDQCPPPENVDQQIEK